MYSDRNLGKNIKIYVMSERLKLDIKRNEIINIILVF